MSGTLVLVRHGQSEWNLKNLFTGWRDVDLTEQGTQGGQERRPTSSKARGMKFDIAFTSALSRAQEDLPASFSTRSARASLKTIRDQALNERDYGDLSGLNKDDARAKWGEEQVHIWRRSYDIPPPGGESLRDTGARVWPYYLHDMQPHVLRGGTVLVAAHGNSLRALIMAIEGMTGEEIVKLELGTGVPIIYRLNADSTLASKEILDGRLMPLGRQALQRRAKTALTRAGLPAYISARLPRWRNW